MGLRAVANNVFSKVANSLGLRGSERVFADIEVGAVNGTLELGRFQSEALTVEEWFVATIGPSVGGAGFESFTFFSHSSIAFPSNAYMFALSLVRETGSPTAAVVAAGDLTAAPLNLVIYLRWASTSVAGLMNPVGDDRGVPLPFKLTEFSSAGTASPVAIGSLIPTVYTCFMDPAAIGDEFRLSMLVRSAPDGIPVWGT